MTRKRFRSITISTEKKHQRIEKPSVSSASSAHSAILTTHMQKYLHTLKQKDLTKSFLTCNIIINQIQIV